MQVAVLAVVAVVVFNLEVLWFQELHAHLNTSFDTQTLQQLVARKAKTNQEILSWSLSIADYKEMDEWVKSSDWQWPLWLEWMILISRKKNNIVIQEIHMYIHTHMRAYMYTLTCAHQYTHTCTHKQAYTCKHTNTRTHRHRHRDSRKHTHTHLEEKGTIIKCSLIFMYSFVIKWMWCLCFTEKSLLRGIVAWWCFQRILFHCWPFAWWWFLPCVHVNL